MNERLTEVSGWANIITNQKYDSRQKYWLQEKKRGKHGNLINDQQYKTYLLFSEKKQYNRLIVEFLADTLNGKYFNNEHCIVSDNLSQINYAIKWEKLL